ncbi:MAG: hypothetical protein ABFS56_03325 [Pseudomonadota bacterium]
MNLHKEYPHIKHEIKQDKRWHEDSGRYLSGIIQSLLYPEMVNRERVNLILSHPWSEQLPPDSNPSEIVKWIDNFVEKFNELIILNTIPFVHATLWLSTEKRGALDEVLFRNMVERALKGLLKDDYPYLAVAHWESNLQLHLVHIIVATVNEKGNKWESSILMDTPRKWHRICEMAKEQFTADKKISLIKNHLEGFNFHKQRFGLFINQNFAKQFLQYIQGKMKLQIYQDDDLQRVKYHLLSGPPVEDMALEPRYSLEGLCQKEELDYDKVLEHIKQLSFSKKGRDEKSLIWRDRNNILLFFVIMFLLLGYYVFFLDNTLQINLPNKFSETQSVWLYDEQGWLCEEGKRDNSRYEFKCRKAKTLRISDYKLIALESLQNDGNGHYQVQERDMKPLTQWPVVFSDNQALPFAKDTKVHFFESELDCKVNQNALEEWLPYRESVISKPMTLKKQPRWAKIISGDEELSYCAEGKERVETQNFYVTLSFTSKKFAGKRKVVVIAPSEHLGRGGIGHLIRETLKNWLLDLKKTQTTIPLTILLIGSNGEINTLIRSEDLRELPNTGQNSIVTKVNGLAFASESFKSVHELRQVDNALEGKAFDRVLYLTDGKSYSGTLSSSLKRALEIPQLWLDNGVSLSVLTVNNCEFWETHTEAECYMLDNKFKKIAKWRVNEMLKKLLQSSKY